MIPLYQHILGITSLSLFVIARLLWLHPGFRRWAMPRLELLGTRLLALLNPDPEVDPFTEELYRVMRRERLEADLQRLRRLLATDMSMSATRQIGNRLAYDWVLREYDRNRREEPAEPLGQYASSHAATPTTDARRDLTFSPSWQRPSTVEVLDIGWRN